jgi:ribonucleoside-diphosphate reductase alpha chain
MTARRQRLPSRRACESFEFRHDGFAFTASAGFFEDGHLGELFLSSHKPGSPIEAIARDSAIMASLALQHGVALETIRAALTRDHDGGPATAIGAALDALAGAAP